MSVYLMNLSGFLSKSLHPPFSLCWHCSQNQSEVDKTRPVEVFVLDWLTFKLTDVFCYEMLVVEVEVNKNDKETTKKM